jgi:hypothetical protein
MDNASAIITAWREAADTFAGIISAAAQMRTGSNGTLFLDHFPPVYDAAAIFISGGSDNVPWLGDNPPTEINMDFRVEGRFRDRARAMEFVAQIMAVLPIKRQGRILVAQPFTAPTMAGTYFKLRDTDTPQLLFAAEITGRIVFRV